MFTGIIREIGTVKKVGRTGSGRRLVIKAKSITAAPGDSIAVNGVCLTALPGQELAFDVVPETLSKTTLGRLMKGDRINLEPALRAGDPLGGHFVQGHVDGVGSVISLLRKKKEVILKVDVDAVLLSQMVPKGSIAIDGVSLTVVDVEVDHFTIALVPFTLKHTTLGKAKKGTPVNIETDMLGKYARRRSKGVSRELLERAGFL